jgi:hypothetical protein
MTQWCFGIRKLGDRDGEERFAFTLASDHALPGGRDSLRIDAPLTLEQSAHALTGSGSPWRRSRKSWLGRAPSTNR